MIKSNILLVICLVFIGGLFVISVFEISPIWGFLYAPKDHLDKEVSFTGIVIKEPDVRNNNTKLTIRTEQEKILITTNPTGKNS